MARGVLCDRREDKSMSKYIIAFLIAAAPLAACKSKSTDADNTARNDRDQKTAPTADNAANGGSDDPTCWRPTRSRTRSGRDVWEGI